MNSTCSTVVRVNFEKFMLNEYRNLLSTLSVNVPKKSGRGQTKQIWIETVQK